MRSTCFGISLILASSAISAGGPAQQFASGYGGISWGTSVDDVIGMMPDGNLYFALPEGSRDYIVKNDDPIFGISRSGQTLQYHFGVDGRVDQIEVHVAYESREQLVDAMISQFGAAYSKRHVGSTESQFWAVDGRTFIGIRVSRASRYGIAEFFVVHSGASQPIAVAK